jgi:predicted O-methyltransferase YrrM
MKSRGVFLAFLCALLACGSSAAPAQRSQSEQDAYDGLNDPRLVSLLKTLAAKSGPVGIHPREARYLYDLIVKDRLSSGLQIGTAGGYGTLWLAMAFGQTGGRLVAVEASGEGARATLARLEQAGQLNRVSLLPEDPLKAIALLAGPYDFVLLDGRKQDYIKYLELLLPIIRPGGFIAAHGVSGKSSDPAGYVRRITGDPTLKTELVPISDAGLSISQKLPGVRMK